jgi:hypothetical protein
MNDDDLSTKLSTGCGDRTIAVALLSTGKDAAGRGSSQWCCTLWARDLLSIPASLSVAVSLSKAALAEANSFLPECQPFCNILRG